jgi:hypothetical protein
MKRWSQPVFALGPEATWDDLINAIEASVQYCSDTYGRFGPMSAFAPLTEPANPDRWEPMRTPPSNLLVTSIERKEDARLLKAFARAENEIRPLLHESPGSPVQIDYERLIADVYDQMERSEVIAFCHTNSNPDDPSFFFLRGLAAINSVNKYLR